MTKKNLLISGALIVLALAGMFFMRTASLIMDDGGKKYYENGKYGISFSYPENYFLEEKEIGDGHRYHYLISLTDDTEENRLVREGLSPGREGPVAITFDFYQNNLDNLSLENWLVGTNNSNFKLSDGTYAKTELSGAEALFYKWSGLYEADVYAFSHSGNIVAATVTYIDPEEQIRKDFKKVLDSVVLK